jgi:branched-chain amino acid transport system substrate-binding protein
MKTLTILLTFIVTLLLLNMPLLGLCEIPEKTRIGVSIPLTGEAATYGTDYRNIYSFANEILAQNRYELLFEDDRCLGRDAVSVAHKFADVDKVRYVLGVSCDGVFSSAAPIYENKKILVISTAASTVKGDYLFHSGLAKRNWVLPLLEYLRGTNGRVGVYSEQTGFAQEFAQVIIDEGQQFGLEVIPNSFMTETSDFITPLLSFKSKNLKGLILLTQTEASLVRIVRQAKKIGLELPLYNAFAAGSPSFLKIVGEKANGITFVDLPSLTDTLTVNGAAIYKQFEEKYGIPTSSESLFSLAFEGFRAMHEAIQSGARPEVFLRTAKFSGITGDWHFGADGFWIGPKMVMKRVENGSVISLKGSKK